MRISPGWITFLVGLVLLALAGLLYQQSLVASGKVGTPGGNTAAAAPAKAIIYTCPMHPQVRQDHPGTCPICGMELVPEEPSASASTATATANSAPAAALAPQKQLYTCPMHPQVIQDHPGTCPICGMELVPKTSDEGPRAAGTESTIANVKLSPTQQMLSDVQPIRPTRETMDMKIPAIGEVTVPEDRMNMLVSWQEGRVDNLVLREAGGKVAKGDHILDIYSEDLVNAQQEYLLALDAVAKLGDSGYDYIATSTKKMLDASRQKLLRLGLTADQLANLEKTHKAEEHIAIYATHSGTVMEKKVTEGMYVMRGEELYSVADLGQVWVEVKIFEQDAASLRPGDKVSFTCPIHPGMLFHGRIDLIEPELDMQTKTLKVRVIVDNPQGILKPGLVMDAEITVDYGKLLLLPRNAVLHTGDGDLVYVMKGEGIWEPRRVTVGRDFGDKVEISAGLKPGESVAGTAVFMLDSEAQLKGVPRPTDEAQNSSSQAKSGSTNAGK
jgi:membrane fusion protein, copper/silver efflux system